MVERERQKKRKINKWNTILHILYLSCAHISDRPLHITKEHWLKHLHVCYWDIRVSVRQYKPLTLQTCTRGRLGGGSREVTVWPIIEQSFEDRPALSLDAVMALTDDNRVENDLLWPLSRCQGQSAARSLRLRWAKVRSMLTAPHRCKDLLLSLLGKLKE